MEIKYLGHSAFLIKTGNQGILLDPYLDFSKEYSDIEKFKNENIRAIIVTHAHSDHLGKALEISKITNAPIISIFELGNFCISKGVQAIPAGIGGKIKLPLGNVTLVPAQHSSSIGNGIYLGNPCGVIMEIEGKTIYHAGDTALSSEMNMISDYYKPDLCMLPIGGHYTMGIDEACYAAKVLKSKKIIPMHYNSFPPIKVNIYDFVNKIKEQGQSAIVLGSDEKIEF